MTIIQKRSRHRKSEIYRNGSSQERIDNDPRQLRYVSPVRRSKYSGLYLKHIVRHKNGVGRPPLIGRDNLIMQEIRRWGHTHPRVAALAVRLAKYDEVVYG